MKRLLYKNELSTIFKGHDSNSLNPSVDSHWLHRYMLIKLPSDNGHKDHETKMLKTVFLTWYLEHTKGNKFFTIYRRSFFLKFEHFSWISYVNFFEIRRYQLPLYHPLLKGLLIVLRITYFLITSFHPSSFFCPFFGLDKLGEVLCWCTTSMLTLPWFSCLLSL